jgi:hypothetical protein
MTKKDYVAIAKVIRQFRQYSLLPPSLKILCQGKAAPLDSDYLVTESGNVFAEDNPNFNLEKWKEATK